MDEETREHVTTVIVGWDPEASDARPGSLPEDLMPIVYDELRRLAGHYMAGERPGHTLQPTELVHQAYVRLVDGARVSWEGRTHFFAVAAKVMRRVLIDHAREREAMKRGGPETPMRITFAEGLPQVIEVEREALIELNTVLERLAALDERQARVVELRFFAGLGVSEVAEALGVSKRTVEGDWTHAKAWLRQELSGEDSG